MHGFSLRFSVVLENTTKPPIVWKNLGNQYSYFPIAQELFFHEIPILWYTSPHGKCIGFLINFPQHRKMQQNPTNGESLGNWYPYLFHSVSAFFHQIPILWYTSSYGKCMDFLINFSQHGNMQQNLLYWDSLRNWYSYYSHRMCTVFPLDPHSMVFFVIWEVHGFPHSIEKCSETHLIGRAW